MYTYENKIVFQNLCKFPTSENLPGRKYSLCPILATKIEVLIEIMKSCLTVTNNFKNSITYFPKEKLKIHAFFFSIMIQLNSVQG